MYKLVSVMAIILLLLVTGCSLSGNETEPKRQPDLAQNGAEPLKQTGDEVDKRGVSVEYAPEGSVDFSKEELLRIKEELSANRRSIQVSQSILLSGVGIGRDQIHVMARSYGDFERTLTEADAERLKQALYELIGKPFPVKLELGNCCSESGSTKGKITQVEGNRVLVIDDERKNGNTEDPVATWISMTDDGKVVERRKGKDAGKDVPFGQLKVSMTVEAWFTGIMLHSYPGQATALKIEVLE